MLRKCVIIMANECPDMDTYTPTDGWKYVRMTTVLLFPLNYIAKNYVLSCSINFKSEDYLSHSLGGLKGRSKSHHQISIIQIIQIIQIIKIIKIIHQVTAGRDANTIDYVFRLMRFGHRPHDGKNYGNLRQY